MILTDQGNATDHEMEPTAFFSDPDSTDSHQHRKGDVMRLRISSRNRRLDRTIIEHMMDGSEHCVSDLRVTFPSASRQQLTGSLLRLKSKGMVVSYDGPEVRSYRISREMMGRERVRPQVRHDDGRDPLSGERART